ncbi:hypothetical protein [Klebsiella aerogenes]|uniref:hypothetical protein n=1 Tax=Klebsiella aerogenes TaxID=548 RepID=UPI0013C2DB9D|nr:hypothetical protein [Klebsiella aerogenes]
MFERIRTVGLIYQQSSSQMIPAVLKIKNPRKAGSGNEGNSNVGYSAEDTLAWVWWPVVLLAQRPDGLDYEPVIRSGHYLVLVDGIEPP